MPTYRAERRRQERQRRPKGRNWLTRRNLVIGGVITTGLVIATLAPIYLGGGNDLPEPTYAPVVAEAPTSISEIITGTSSPDTIDDRLTFEQAREDPSLRQQYIDQLVKGHDLPEYVNSVEYIHTQEDLDLLASRGLGPRDQLGFKTQMITYAIGLIEDYGKRKISSSILVLPETFEDPSIEHEGDFKALLFDKEFENARCAYEGFGSFGMEKFRIQDTEKESYNPILLQTVLDLCGYKPLVDNLISLGELGISTETQRDIRLANIRFYTDLWDPKYENVGEGSLDFLKIEFFQPWLLNTPAIKREARPNGTEIGYIIDFNGDRLQLPSEVPLTHGITPQN